MKRLYFALSLIVALVAGSVALAVGLDYQVAKTRVQRSLKASSPKQRLAQAEAAGSARRADENVSPYSLPALIEPADADKGRLKIVDANSDGKTWTFDAYSGKPILKYSYNTNSEADDWVFIPVTQSQAQTRIKVVLAAYAKTSTYEEKLQVCIGTEAKPAAMTPMGETIVIDNMQAQDFTWEASSSGAGIKWIGLHCVSDANKYELHVRNIRISSVSDETPKTPVVASSLIEGQSFTAQIVMPALTVVDGAFTGVLSLRVMEGDSQLYTAPAQGGQTLDVALTLPVGQHVLSFVAVQTVAGVDHVSDAATISVKSKGVKNYTVPFSMQPTRDEFEDDCTVLNANGDLKTWEYDVDNGAMAYYYNTFEDADDWVFLPAIDFAQGGIFKFAFQARVRSGSDPETFAVYLGDTPAAADMTSTIMPATEIDSEGWQNFSYKASAGAGKKYIGIHCTSPKNRYTLYVRNISVTEESSSTPAMPTLISSDFDGTQGAIVAKLPTLDVAGSPLTGQVGLDVYADGQVIATAAPAAPGSQVTVPVTLPLGIHSMKIEAYVGTGDSRLVSQAVPFTVTVSNREGYAYPLPFFMQPTRAESEILTLVNANEDDICWEYHPAEQAMRIKWSDYIETDDWIILPPIDITSTDNVYTFSMEARAGYERFYEKFEVRMGESPDPEALTQVLVEPTETNYEVFHTFGSEFTVAKPGHYYIGIRGLSRRETSSYLYVRAFRVEDTGNSVMAPGRPGDVTATADPSGLLQATISFTLPTQTYQGSPLPSSSPVTVEVSSPTGDKTSVSGLPGQSKSVTLPAKQDWNTFTLTASSDKGPGLGAEVQIWCGPDTPNAPDLVSKVSEDNMKLEITWQPVTTGIHGGPVPQADLHYNIVTLARDQESLIDLGNTENCYYTYAPELIGQEEIVVGISAVNSKGRSELGATYGVLGQPMALPAGDDYSRGVMSVGPMIPLYLDDYHAAIWAFDFPGLVVDDLQSYEGNALICYSPYGGGLCGTMSFPKVDTRGADNLMATLEFYAYPSMPTLTLYASTRDEQNVPIGTIDATGCSGWTKFPILLPASLCEKQWINLNLRADFHLTTEYGILRSWEISSVSDNDLSVSLIAPTDIVVGQPVTFTARVTNHSVEAVVPVKPSLQLQCDGASLTLPVVGTPDLSPLAPGLSRDFQYAYIPHADHLGQITLTATLDYADDKADNNTATAYVQLGKGGKAIVTDLKAEQIAIDPAEYRLTWSEPEFTIDVTDSFEDYDLFSFPATLGPWKNYDGDGKETYGFENVDFEGQADPKAWQVMDASLKVGGESLFMPRSGKQCLMAICPEDGSAANDWLISPEVEKGSDVTFWWNILTSAYGSEQIEVLTSSTGRNAADFTHLQTYTKGAMGWYKTTFTMPADTKYFALRYISEDIMGVLVDDINYMPADAGRLAGYNLYCDGLLCGGTNDLLTAQTTTHVPGDTRDHDYNVAVMIDTASGWVEHPHSNTAHASYSTSVEAMGASGVMAGKGIITLVSLQGMQVTVTDAAGLRVASIIPSAGIETLTVASGIYTVTYGNNTAKLIVR